MAGREIGVRKLMTANLLKRLESSVHSFKLTLERVKANMADTLARIDDYKLQKSEEFKVSDMVGMDDYDLDVDDDEEMSFEVGNATKFDLADMDWLSWERDIIADVENIDVLLAMIDDIGPEHDAKLIELKDQIKGKVESPINPDNKKVIIFTAFADTAEYLFDHVSKLAPKMSSG